MTQISKGDTFTDGQQVTGARLNQLVDSSTLLAGAITDQTALTAATVAVDDGVLLSDTSASALRKATVGDLLGSSLPVVASSVTSPLLICSATNAGANSDILVTPYDGIAVTGKTFTSADGITATVTSTAHGLVAGMIVNITAAVSAYSGQYQILVPTVDTFTYSVLPTTTASSGTCSYTRKASKRIAGNLVVSGEADIAGNLRVLGTTKAYLTTDSTAITQTTGDNSTKVATTAFVTAAISAAPVIKAFTKNTGTTLNAQFNIASVTNASAGTFVYTFTTALTDANYVVNATAFININYNYYCMVTAMSTTGFTVQVGYAVSYGGAFVAANPTSMLVSVIR